MKTVKKAYEEFWGYYWRVTDRHKIPGIFQWDLNLVDLVEKKCSLPPRAKILDLGCGGGDQAKVFAKKGYRVVGIDKVKSLIEFANKSFREEGLNAEFIVGDMLHIDYDGEFDLCVIFSGTFGFFSDDKNRDLLVSVKRALKTGGHAFISYNSLEYWSCQKHRRSWGHIDGGFSLTEEWFDVPTATYRSTIKHIMMDDQIVEPTNEEEYHANEVIRCYGAHEIERLAESIGFEVSDHLSRKHIDNHDYSPKPDEPCGIILLRKID